MMQPENYADPTLWEACSGRITRLPTEGSVVYYFPEIHVEHVLTILMEPCVLPQITGPIACKVVQLHYMANVENDDVFAKVQLEPLSEFEFYTMTAAAAEYRSQILSQEETYLFKSLTSSDIHGSCLIPICHVERVFPALDRAFPEKFIQMRDVHGKVWPFRYVNRESPRRHSLTSGWVHFAREKNLMPGDSVVFMRGEGGEYHVGIRQDIERVMMVQKEIIRSSIGSIVEAMYLAAAGKPFEAVYYPRAGTPVFFVGASVANPAIRRQLTGWGINCPLQFTKDEPNHSSFITQSNVDGSNVDTELRLGLPAYGAAVLEPSNMPNSGRIGEASPKFIVLFGAVICVQSETRGSTSGGENEMNSTADDEMTILRI